jgi:hypothetical protein
MFRIGSSSDSKGQSLSGQERLPRYIDHPRLRFMLGSNNVRIGSPSDSRYKNLNGQVGNPLFRGGSNMFRIGSLSDSKCPSLNGQELIPRSIDHPRLRFIRGSNNVRIWSPSVSTYKNRCGQAGNHIFRVGSNTCRTESLSDSKCQSLNGQERFPR